MESHIVLTPEILGYMGSLPVSNTLLVSWMVMGFLLIISVLATKNVQLVPTGLQNLVELVIEGIYNTVSELAQEKTKVIFPVVATFFLFILTANWLGLLPGFATITYKNLPLLRSINSDLNMTLSLALVSAVITHGLAIRYLGVIDYLKKWFSFNPIFLFVGLLELVSEFTKIVSLSFRLFGNIFAGEVVLSTVAGIFAFLIPLPFYFLEIIVGFVQAAVFMMLSLVFMVLLSEKHTNEH
ncbi:ATP synthase F0 subunit A [Candidatus Daviesbacteria bacterium RIFCSPLOWO2_02_FULL_40_8]|uniref:ATP synthase subunit a n=1 Tax=Candidatus Daviesbacteria bacterium RIFCSPLOWO2_01_FULL_40_24 TaxID=1797787 RepID=A0A1F5MIV2_9BACT|nr:MAG: ATP synthase F0 subunit A [Candidatus Daviesbacteria bacterium RIFCSPHIGHO2_01_FULL_41_45]OGE35557.1 MAG: ATP synthase F0 subunit A [Candidatus Daviesbacteria bacterium RIFCSPHIGHO2_02_FULL_41_14]OGE65306.1 MAG: ATP synthase F0 subunit A [Candidatus Daviesbacteria bacterium RIFCSPLOWO2_01_FULL_40_24]OGE66954.1 MAG: ATP synthase F0 subunit A [Candidatus Daviesbacteria bacterium RIFCSPLOWO2_02_FULL_40_8]